MSSQYPNKIDTNVELPSVEDNLTEIGGDAINGLREAVFNIEETLGVNPQGSAYDVVSRLNVSLNSDGTIKSSALAIAGLLTSPIVDVNVASNAGISESKLDLDYSTTGLKVYIDQGIARIDNLSSSLVDIIGKVNRHISHPSSWGRHETQDIDGYIGKYSTVNLQGIINDLDSRIEDHVFSEENAHEASSVSADDSLFLYSAGNVQEALNYLNNLGLLTMINHRDNDHDNGILSTQDVTLPNSKRSVKIIDNFPLFNVSSGTSFVKCTAPPSGFGKILRGDVLVVYVEGEPFEYRVSKIDSSTNIIYFVGSLTKSGSATAYVYRKTEELTAISVLKPIIVQDNVYSVGGSIIKVVNPNSPFIMSSNSRPWNLKNEESQICLSWPNGNINIDGLDLKSEMETQIGNRKSNWNIENCVLVLNRMFMSHDMPVFAFEHNGEMGIVYDGVDGYVEIVGPSSNSAWGALGFIEGNKVYGLGTRKFYIDGYEYYDFRLISDSNGNTDGSLVIKNIDKNLVLSGVVASGFAKITPTNVNYYDSTIKEKTGNVIFTTRTENTLTTSSSIISSLGEKDVNVKIYADSFCLLNAPEKRTLYEIFLNGYSSPYAEVRGMPRVEYYNCQQRRPNDPENWFDIISVSRNFSFSQKRIYYNGNYQVMFGDRGSDGTLSNYGNVVSLPTNNAEGHKFRLYDNSNIDYIELEIINPNYINPDVTSNTNSIDVDIFDRISEDLYLQIGTVLHNRTKFKNLNDRRVFGTTGRKSISNVFKRDYISYPTSLLRGCGVIFGLEVSENISTASISVNISGGKALVNGSVVLIPKTNLSIPLNLGDTTYNIFINENGILQILEDDSKLGLINPSLSEIISSSNKLMLAQVEYIESSETIDEIRDYRRFVGDLDGKIDLIVGDTENEKGTFSSLRSAVNYLHSLYPNNLYSNIIKIKGTNYVDLSEGPLVLPSGTSIIGDNTGSKNGESYGAKIVLTGSSTDSFLIPGNNCSIENVYIECATGSSCVSIIGDNNNDFVSLNPTLVIKGLRVIGCTFKNTTGDIIVFGEKFEDCVFKENYIHVKATNYPSFVSGSDPSNLSGVFLAAKDITNVIISNNHCYCYGNGNMLSFVYGYRSATNVLVENNIISAAGLLGYGINAIEFKNANNVHVLNNKLTFLSATYEGVLESGVVNLNGNVFDCSINNNIIFYKNSVSQNNFWSQATENISSNDASFAPGYIISINSSTQLIYDYASENLQIDNICVNGNHIEAMCSGSVISVGVGNGFGKKINVSDNIIDNSYIMLSGISINNTDTLDLTEPPLISDIFVNNNYVKNSIKINYSNDLYNDLHELFAITPGLISIGELNSTSYTLYPCHFSNVYVENNSLLNDFINQGLIYGLYLEKISNSFVSQNNISKCFVKNLGAPWFAKQTPSIYVNGFNMCHISKNNILDCDVGIFIKNNSFGSLDFSSEVSIVENHINSISDNSTKNYLVYGEGVKGKIEINNNTFFIQNNTKDAFIYIFNCIGDRYINSNLLYSFGDYKIEQPIMVYGEVGGIQKTHIHNNVINIEGEIGYGSISCWETDSIKNIYITRNYITGKHKKDSISTMCLSGYFSNILIEGNIITNTGINNLEEISDALIKCYSDSVGFSVSIKNNFIVGEGSAIYVNNIYGLDVIDNQLLGPTSHISPSIIDDVFGIGCYNCNYTDISSNFVINYHYPIIIKDSIDISGSSGTMNVTENIITNSTVNFLNSIWVSDINYTDCVISDNIIHCTNIDETTTAQKLIVCELMTLSRTFICRNSLLSVKNISYGILFLSSDIITSNLVISDNNLLLKNVVNSYGGVGSPSCICIGTKNISETSTLSNCFISNNLISGTKLTSNGIFVYSDFIFDLSVNNNRIYSTEADGLSSNLSDSMIKVIITKIGNNISISNNLCENFVNGKGVVNGFGYLFGGNSTGLIINNNIFKKINYYNISTVCSAVNMLALGLNGINDFNISNNIIIDSTIGINIVSNIERMVVSNNIVDSYGYAAFSLTGVTSNDIVISGNCFSSLSEVVNFALFNISMGSSGEQILISGNLFNSKDNSPSHEMLFVGGLDGVFVTNNNFCGGGYYITQPLKISGSESICSFNNLRDINYGLPPYPSKIICGGSNYCNFGENYEVPIPLSSFNIPVRNVMLIGGEDIVGSWKSRVGGLEIYETKETTYYGVSNILYCSFGENIVPSGAKINHIKLQCISTGDEEGIHVSWKKRNFLESSVVDVMAERDISNVGAFIEYLSPDSLTYEKLSLKSEHFIYIIPQGPGGGVVYQLWFTGASIQYTL